MSEVAVPLNDEAARALAEGRKRHITSLSSYGSEGDTFRAFGGVYKIVRVSLIPLGRVADAFYAEEGASSPGEFKRQWVDSHKMTGFVPARLVCVHVVEPVLHEGL